MPAESDSAENEDIEDKEAEANELFEFKAKFREDVEVFLETAEENWNKESFRKAVVSFGKKGVVGFIALIEAGDLFR